MKTMCLHSETIDDYSTGDVVCVICGLVLDKVFLSSKKKTADLLNFFEENAVNEKRKDNNLRENVMDFLSRANVHPSFLEHIMKNVEFLVSRFSHFPRIMIIASACFVCLAKTEYPVALTKFESMACKNRRDKKNLYRMVVSLKEPSIYPNLSSHVADNMLQGLELSFCDIQSIKSNIEILKCKFCTYSPLTVVAAHTLLYSKGRRQLTTLSKICLHIGVSKTSVYSYINSKRHTCVQKWNNVYEQLSYR